MRRTGYAASHADAKIAEICGHPRLDPQTSKRSAMFLQPIEF
jgi:hypothetical protein